MSTNPHEDVQPTVHPFGVLRRTATPCDDEGMSQSLDEAADLITVGEAAQLLGMHQATVYRWIKSGVLSPVQVRSRRRATRPVARVLRVEVQRLLAEERVS
jgi:excisionase family DNA binding protein